MRKWTGMTVVLTALALMGAECQPGINTGEPIPAGTYRGTIAGTSKLTDAGNNLLETNSSQASITLVVDAAGKPISINVQTSPNAPSQTLTEFGVGKSQRFQYTYNDPQNGAVNVDYTATVIRSEQGNAYVIAYTFTGTQTTAFGVTSMYGNNEYQFYNQGSAVWVIHSQTSTLTPPGGQGMLHTSVYETGVLPKTN